MTKVLRTGIIAKTARLYRYNACSDNKPEQQKSGVMDPKFKNQMILVVVSLTLMAAMVARYIEF